MSNALHAHTPLVAAVDGRGLTVRTTEYRKLQDQDDPLALTSRMAYDAAGRLTALWDPRLWALAQQDAPTSANRTHHYNLSGIPLLSESVDAGSDLALLAEAGNVVQSWDSRGSCWQTRYDEYLRPVATIEIDAQQNARTISRLVYADNSDTSAEHNQCGQLVRQDDTAGSLHFADYGILSQLLSQPRQFLKTLDLPDWTETTDYLDLVETEELTTQWQYNALGEPVLQTDARGHAQRFAYSVAGDVNGVYLRLNAQDETTLVDNMIYNPFGQVETQTAGNGVVSNAFYEPSSGLLQSLTANLAGNKTVQSLHYGYDPLGNILQTEDTAQPIRFFANQRIEPVSHYRYDTLYQLIEATGRETNTGASHGPALPVLQNLPSDPDQISNYTQSYEYDTAGNLLQMRHVGAHSFTRTMRVAADSNRSLPEGETDVDFDTGFDANGNQLQLVRGQTLEWDLRNQLQQITTVTRATRASDNERYIYDSQGQRCRKVNSTQTSSRTLNNEVRYLPGLEIRTTADGEILQVITAQAGRSNVRVLHWQAGQPSGIANDQIRYSLSDHLGSSTLELDHQGGLISQESYYPFGGTAWWAARSKVEAKYKTVRYSGKECDASGLYYYGFRYYAPWLQRWINPDPSGDIDGLNLYRMVENSPVSRIDDDGRMNSLIRRETRDHLDASMDALDILRRESVSPEGRRASVVAHNIRNSEALLHAVYLHIRSLKVLDRRLKVAAQQLDNMFSRRKFLISSAQRVGIEGGKLVASAATGLITGVAIAAGTGLTGTIAGTAVAITASMMTNTALGAALSTVLERKNIGQPTHLHTSPLSPATIRHEVLRKATKQGWVKFQIDKIDPSTSSGLTKDIDFAIGTVLSDRLGDLGSAGITVFKIIDDITSTHTGKMPSKLEQLGSFLDTHKTLINTDINFLETYLSEAMGDQGRIRIGYKVYTHQQITEETMGVLSRLSTVRAKVDRAIYNKSLGR